MGWLWAVTADGALRLTIQLADLTLDYGLADSAVRMALALALACAASSDAATQRRSIE